MADRLPVGLRVSAAVCWRLLVIAAALYVLGRVTSALQLILIPVALALLLAALLAPAVTGLARRGVPRALATVMVIVGGLATLGGVGYGVVVAFMSGLPALRDQLSRSVAQISNWLATGPLHVPRGQLDNLVGSLGAMISAHRSQLTAGALGVVTTVGEMATGALLTLFTLIFFLYNGGRIWSFLLRVVPAASRDRVDVAGRRGFASLVAYTRAVALVSITDATLVALGLWLIRVPLVVPLAALVFFGAFIPTVGAIVTGAVAVLVALVAGGLLPALLVVVVLIIVGQVEGHVLQPLLLGRAVRLHPLAVVLPVATGLVVAGIVGALLAVPLVAVLSSAGHSLATPRRATPAAVDPVNPAHARPETAAAPSRLRRLRRRLVRSA